MAVSRADLEAGRVDLTDVTTGETMPPLHPGAILQEEFMESLDLSANKLAKHIGVPVTRVSEILHGRRRITTNTAMRLGKLFNTSARLWLNLQTQYDLEIAERDLREAVDEEVRPLQIA